MADFFYQLIQVMPCNHSRYLRVLHDVEQFWRCQAEIHGDSHQTGTSQSHIHLHPLDAVVGQQSHALARL